MPVALKQSPLPVSACIQQDSARDELKFSILMEPDLSVFVAYAFRLVTLLGKRLG